MIPSTSAGEFDQTTFPILSVTKTLLFPPEAILFVVTAESAILAVVIPASLKLTTPDVTLIGATPDTEALLPFTPAGPGKPCGPCGPTKP